eukprot:2919676-Lingulodinium_polyedra.AAC.1
MPGIPSHAVACRDAPCCVVVLGCAISDASRRAMPRRVAPCRAGLCRSCRAAPRPAMARYAT